MATKYKNTTIYKRCTHSENHPYTVVSNYLIRELQNQDEDKKLNITELGFMLYLLSHSDTYIFNSKYVQEHISGIGQDKYYAMVKKLTKLGYIQKTRTEGQTNWIINEILFNIPSETTDTVNSSDINTIDINTIENTTIENTTIENTTIENTTIISTNETSNNETSKNEIIKKEINNNESVIMKKEEKISLGLDSSSSDSILITNSISNLDASINSNTDSRVKNDYENYKTSNYFKEVYITNGGNDYLKFCKMTNSYIPISKFEKVLFFINFQFNNIKSNEEVNKNMISKKHEVFASIPEAIRMLKSKELINEFEEAIKHTI